MIVTYKGHRKRKFKNGYTVSIFNGFGSYSENHFNYDVRDNLIFITKTCEVAIIFHGQFVTKNHLDCCDSVKGYVDKQELKRIIKMVKKLK